MPSRSPALIFDIDGTLLDTEDFIISAFRQVVQNNSLAIKSTEYFRSLIGLHLADIYQKLDPGASPKALEALCKEHVAFQTQNIGLTKTYPHVRETLALLHSRGVPMGIFTSRRSASVVPTLTHGGIDTFFTAIIAGDHTQLGKPHPEGVQKALQVLGAHPHHAFMVGDTDLDILAGKNATTKTIAVSWGLRGKEVYSYGADFVIDSMKDIIPIVLGEKLS
ncbi:HAD-IA family hydrolase [Candidatus Uhrbacteria bacterium]|nr:HAD-IA family hydrolase [Candidatus Uhrbacteria bacterium]